MQRCSDVPIQNQLPHITRGHSAGNSLPPWIEHAPRAEPTAFLQGIGKVKQSEADYDEMKRIYAAEKSGHIDLVGQCGDEEGGSGN
jgi:hypothetical protein